MSAETPNTVTRHDDYIEVVWHGAQNADSVRRDIDAITVASKQLIEQHRPVRISLSMLDHPMSPDMGAFKEDLRLFRQIEVARMVISGNLSPMVMSLVTTVINSFQKELEIAYLKEPTKALAWLLSDEPGPH